MKDKYDVLVVGGGAAGVGAAVGAAKTGARVGLVEAAGCLGGAIPANRLKSKPRSWSAAAQERGCS